MKFKTYYLFYLNNNFVLGKHGIKYLKNHPYSILCRAYLSYSEIYYLKYGWLIELFEPPTEQSQVKK